MEDYTAAPSLQGSAEQLAVRSLPLTSIRILLTATAQLARQFSLSATPGRRKVRPGKRERLLSRAAVQSHTLTGSSSPRRAVAVTAASGGFPAASNTPRLRYNAAPRAGADPTETNSDTKRRRSSATSATFGWNTFASPSSSKTLQQAEDKPSVPSEKAAHTHAQPLDATSTSKLTEGRSPPVPEVKDITNMLQARTSGNIATIAMPRVPSKESVARAGNLTNREIEQTASQRLVPNPEIDDGRETDPAASPSMPEHKSSELPIRSVKAEAPFAWSDLDADAPVPVKPRLADTQSSLKGNTPLVRKADTANDESLAAIAYLKFEVVRLSNRTKIMEQENFTMQKQLETVLQAEELPQIFRYFECESTVWTRCQMS